MAKKDYIYGARAVIEAIESGRQIDKVLLRRGLESDLRKEVSAKARDAGIPVQQVPPETLDRLVRDGNHQGVLAFTAIVYYYDIEDIVIGLNEQGKVPLLVMLDQVSDVRNFGAIARTAECMGVHALIIPQQGAARINADAMKVSAGALNHLPVARVHHLVDTLHLLQSYGIRLVACTEKAADSILEVELDGPTCLVFGAEDKGITPKILKTADSLARIPMQGKISSLNVSVSVGMVLMETNRQRRLAATN